MKSYKMPSRALQKFFQWFFRSLAIKPLEFLRVFGVRGFFSVWLPTCYQWWVGKEQNEILYEKKRGQWRLLLGQSSQLLDWCNYIFCTIVESVCIQSFEPGLLFHEFCAVFHTKSQKLSKGPIINYITQILPLFDPLPPP